MRRAGKAMRIESSDLAVVMKMMLAVEKRKREARAAKGLNGDDDMQIRRLSCHGTL